MPNNVCPQCKRSDVLNWIHDQKTDRFICAICSDNNFHVGRTETANVLTEQALAKLPPGEQLYFVETKDKGGNLRAAVAWLWKDKIKVRKSFFDRETGEYLGEAA